MKSRHKNDFRAGYLPFSNETFMFRIIKDIFSYDHDYSGRVLTNLGLLSDCQEHCLGQHRWSEKIC